MNPLRKLKLISTVAKKLKMKYTYKPGLIVAYNLCRQQFISQGASGDGHVCVCVCASVYS